MLARKNSYAAIAMLSNSGQANYPCMNNKVHKCSGGICIDQAMQCDCYRDKK